MGFDEYNGHCIVRQSLPMLVKRGITCSIVAVVYTNAQFVVRRVEIGNCEAAHIDYLNTNLPRGRRNQSA